MSGLVYDLLGLFVGRRSNADKAAAVAEYIREEFREIDIYSGVPGSIVSEEQLIDGVVVHRNGNGTIIKVTVSLEIR